MVKDQFNYLDYGTFNIEQYIAEYWIINIQYSTIKINFHN